MAQTTTTKAPRKTITLRSRKDVQAVEQAGLKKHDEPAKPTESIWVHALEDAGGFHRDALQLELAVGLSLFAVKADAAKVNLPAKKALREVYAKAGYACATPQGEDYKTVMRRINVAADLYQFIGGRETIVDWIGDTTPKQQIRVIMEHVKGYNFDGINSVLAYMGKAVAVKRPREGIKNEGMSEADKRVAEATGEHIEARREAEKAGQQETLRLPPGRVFTHGAMQVAIPFEATYEDVMAVITDLMEFAKNQMAPTAVVAASH